MKETDLLDQAMAMLRENRAGWRMTERMVIASGVSDGIVAAIGVVNKAFEKLETELVAEMRQCLVESKHAKADD